MQERLKRNVEGASLPLGERALAAAEQDTDSLLYAQIVSGDDYWADNAWIDSMAHGKMPIVNNDERYQ